MNSKRFTEVNKKQKLMKQILILFTLLVIIGCSKDTIFVLKDTDNQKYYLSDSIRKIAQNNQISLSPIIIIDGIPIKYDIEKDTVFLPLQKKDLYQILFLNKRSATVIYGSQGGRGAIIITTKPNPK
ncbi:hypothetical protein [Flavobacterium sp. FlaQc-50]|uniref:hypothetical protein n=1 Tax=unclassified Flavobacterium TaxID=196869 RepID=UPI0037577B07